MDGEGEMFTQGSEQKPVDKSGIAQRVKEVRKWAGVAAQKNCEKSAPKFEALGSESWRTGRINQPDKK